MHMSQLTGRLTCGKMAAVHSVKYTSKCEQRSCRGGTHQHWDEVNF